MWQSLKGKWCHGQLLKIKNTHNKISVKWNETQKLTKKIQIDELRWFVLDKDKIGHESKPSN
jgi:hypothetical protein